MAARAIARNIIGNPWMNGVYRRVPYTASSDTVGRKDRGYVELWNNKLAVEQQRPSGTPTADRGDVGVEVVSIQHHHHHHPRSEGGGGVLKFTTKSSPPPSELISVERLGLQGRPGPFNIPSRQAVEGVVCITNKDAFLLYNPSTGVTSPWIETTTTREGRQCKSIALGFDPRSRKHKVVCISSYVIAPGSTSDDEHVVVEVLNVRNRTWTTGEHKWRRLKDDRAPLPGERIALEDCPVYLDGKIHWQYHRSFHYVLEFHAGREAFFLAPFPEPLSDELSDSARKIHPMLTLMVVEGKIAILKSTSGKETSSSLSLWTCHIKVGGKHEWPEIEWTKENVSPRLSQGHIFSHKVSNFAPL